MHRRTRHLAYLALASAAAIGLVGCAPGGSTPTSQDTAPTVTDAAKMGDVTLTLVDFWHDAEGEWMQKSIDEFHAKYPNITVKRTVQDWGQIMDTLSLRLTESDAPDVVTVNNGWQSMGTLAKGGLIVNLDGYADAYGWNDVIPSTIKRQLTFTTDGTQMGTGSLWAAPSARVQNIGVYYNKKLLDQVGAEVPTDLASFEKAAAALKAADITPIAYGETDKPIALLCGVQDALGNRDSIADVVYGSHTVKITQTGLGEAAERVQDWAGKGWLMADYAGLSSADANTKFLDGGAGFVFYYSGLVPIDQPNRADFGYFQLTQDDGTMVATGAPADNLAIGIHSAHKDAAALLLDFLMSEQAAQITADYGYMPLLHQVTSSKGDALIHDEAAAAQKTEADNGYVPYFDWTTPTMLDTLGTQAQLLFAGKSSPDDLVTAVQADLDAFLAK